MWVLLVFQEVNRIVVAYGEMLQQQPLLHIEIKPSNRYVDVTTEHI